MRIRIRGLHLWDLLAFAIGARYPKAINRLARSSCIERNRDD